MDNNEQQAPTIYWRVDEWFPDLSPEIKTRLKTYHDELIKFNRTLNLISPKTVFVADAIHFADSIIACRTIMIANPSIDKIYDLGSGNGFPGVIFGLLKPSAQVVLVEVDQKKCEFLTHLVGALGLKNVSVENKNVDTMPDNSVKYAICRGFGNISRTILSARKYMMTGGALYHLKAEEWGIEVGEIPSQLCAIWSPSLVGEYKLPVGAVKFGVVKTEKVR